MSFFNSKASKLYLAEYDLTPYITELSGLPGEVGVLEVTTWNDSGFKGIRDIEGGDIGLSLLYSDDAAGSEVATAALRAATTGSPIIYLPAGDTAENLGYATGLALLSNTDTRSRVGSVVEQSATLAKNGIVERVKSMVARSTVSASQNGATIDDAAQSASGGSWYYFISALTATGGNAQWTLKLQDSPDDSVWTDVDSVNLSDVGGARRTFTGTFDRYVRYTLTLDATTGSITFFVAYVRS